MQQIDFGVEGINGPICCLKVDLASKNNKMRSFVKSVEQREALYCGHYSLEGHEQVLARASTKGRFNRILRVTGIPYSPQPTLQESEGCEAFADSMAAPCKKRKCGSGGGAGSSMFRWQKGLLSLAIDSGPSPKAASALPDASRPATRCSATPRPQSM